MRKIVGFRVGAISTLALTCSWSSSWGQDVFDFIDANEGSFDIEIGRDDPVDLANSNLTSQEIDLERLNALVAKDWQQLDATDKAILSIYAEDPTLNPDGADVELEYPRPNRRQRIESVQGLIGQQPSEQVLRQLQIAAESETDSVIVDKQGARREIFTDRSFIFSGGLGINTNPNRRESAGTDYFADLSVQNQLVRDFRDPVSNALTDRFQIDTQISYREFERNEGTDSSTVQTAVSYARFLNACWNISGSLGIQFQYGDFFDDFGATQYPITIRATRNILERGEKCSNRSAETNFSMILSASRILSNPSSANRSQVRYELRKTFEWGQEVRSNTTAWSLRVAPRVTYVNAANLSDGEERDEASIDLRFRLSRNFPNGITLTANATAGTRESSDPTRDAASLDIPFGLTLSKSF